MGLGGLGLGGLRWMSGQEEEKSVAALRRLRRCGLRRATCGGADWRGWLRLQCNQSLSLLRGSMWGSNVGENVVMGDLGGDFEMEVVRAREMDINNTGK